MLPLLLPDWLQRESLKNPYNVASVPDPLIVDHLPRCFTVLDVYNSIRDAANLPPIIDEFKQTADTLSNQAIDEGDSMVFRHFGSVQSAHRVYVPFLFVASILSAFLVTLECQILCTCFI